MSDSLPRVAASPGRPFVFPWLAEILEHWRDFGDPALVVVGELASFVVARSGELYGPRCAWLERHGLNGSADFFLDCWHALDQELTEILREQLAEARERALRDAKNKSS